MSWGYVIGPLVLLPVLGALLLLPHPGAAGGSLLERPVLDRASLSLLVCHGSAGSAIVAPSAGSPRAQ